MNEALKKLALERRARQEGKISVAAPVLTAASGLEVTPTPMTATVLEVTPVPTTAPAPAITPVAAAETPIPALVPCLLVNGESIDPDEAEKLRLLIERRGHLTSFV